MTTAPFTIDTFDAAPQALIQAVDDGLEEHNFSVAPLRDVAPLSAIARDPLGRVIGGAVGRTWGACCELQQLWVHRDERQRGLGTSLLRQFEHHARARGCSIFYLTTLSFQAPGFYKTHGYQVLAEITGYPDGIRKYLMQRIET